MKTLFLILNCHLQFLCHCIHTSFDKNDQKHKQIDGTQFFIEFKLAFDRISQHRLLHYFLKIGIFLLNIQLSFKTKHFILDGPLNHIIQFVNQSIIQTMCPLYLTMAIRFRFFVTTQIFLLMNFSLYSL